MPIKSLTAKKIVAKSLVEVVTERLEEAIIEGDLAPGERIFEQVLATDMGISRGPLREAIRRLEGRRLLTREPNVGVRVAELSSKRLDELLAVREALEGMACRIAAERFTDKEVDELQKMLDKHSDQVHSGKGYYQQGRDFDFHFRIAQATDNEFLISMISGDLYDLLRVYRYKASTMEGRADEALEEHQKIVDALRTRDPDQAEQAMREHIRNARYHAMLALDAAEKKAGDSD